MEREKALYAAEVMKAYAEGKEIESKLRDCDDSFFNITVCPDFLWDVHDYRIKPEPKCRAFKDGEECATEMLKHNPFGWVRHKADNLPIYNIAVIYTYREVQLASDDYKKPLTYEELFECFEFLDGSPFGIPEE